ncbi:hypothetical protein N879_04375 [Alcaligenes sp. EGD-AK7]|uniref:hypothetical protein n=1 Tax=Alcaligenes sp. EGD-AK7 TaxID=1386079 RepID=UPI0003B64650|nr:MULTISPECIES: hypothetical protein [unclassified Alcaligenes]ERI34771.2 hypothetical protein N879_04375 [Alcaligenes sp. EGD-AK7]
MKLNIDSHAVEVPCQACGKKLSQTIGRLKQDPDIKCSCGVTTKIDAPGLRNGIAKAEKSLSDFQRNLSKMFK